MKPALVAKRITTWYAWAGLAVIIIGLPVGYFLLFYQFAAGSLDTEAEITGNIVTQLISRNPDMWAYEQLRLQEILSRRHVGHIEMRRIVDMKDRVIAQAFDVLKPPVITRSADLWDSGVVVARLEISRSMRPLLLHTGIAALLSLLLGLITFVPFMVLPLRAIRRAEQESQASEAKYKTLFDSTTDGVYQVNADGVFTMMNQAGARIFGYDHPDEIIGHSALEYWREARDRDAYRAELEIKKTVNAYPIGAKRKDGEPIELESSSRRLEDGKGNFIGIEGILRDVTERMRLTAQLKSLSLTDELTGLYNRRGFFTLGEHLLKMADRTKKGMFLLYADLDGLKEINDTLGHHEGDRALIETANLLKQTYRKSDVIARLGGDEFAIIPVGFAGNDVEVISARLQRRLDIHNSRMNRGYKLSLSIGIVYCDPDKPCSLDDLLTLADELMYEQKSKKRAQNTR